MEGCIIKAEKRLKIDFKEVLTTHSPFYRQLVQSSRTNEAIETSI